MDFVNQTPLPAELFVSQVGRTHDGTPVKAGLVVAKATFQVRRGSVQLEEAAPLPILEDDVPTELGFLPRDVLPRKPGSAVDVILLAAAYSEGGRPVEERLVELRVGEISQQLLVVGDRWWSGVGEDAVATPPIPFSRMPLTWSSAFGGTDTVWVDASTPVPVSDYRNPHGKGLNVAERAAQLARGWGASDDFPRWEASRPLPNIEDPQARIMHWNDEPEPVCWASMPLDLGLRAVPVLEPLRDAKPECWAGVVKDHAAPMSYAHPSWRLNSVPPGTPVRLTGCRPDGEFAFRVPDLRVSIDYQIGTRIARRSLPAVQLLLLPEDERACMTFSMGFRLPSMTEATHRSARLLIDG